VYRCRFTEVPAIARLLPAFLVALTLSAAPVHAQGTPSPRPAWPELLQAELIRVAAQNTAGIGVYVRDLETGIAVSHRGMERWYLASTVKVPVALAVLQAVERGDFALETKLRVRASDYVDGAGQTNSKAVGTALSVRYLLEQMVIYSDNTASDMLIGLVGIRAVNALVQQFVPQGFERITSLADVRRHAYGYLTPQASHLSGHDFLVIKRQRSDSDRVQVLSRLLHVPPHAFLLPSVGDAFEAYYASGLNSGRLDAYADLLELLVNGKIVNAEHTRYLLEVMERVQTGVHRVQAGLPKAARFAHKTGTQRARTCDSGLVTVPRLGRDRRIIVVACTRGELSSTRSDRALRDVGAALCQSGLLTDGRTHDPECPPVARVVHRADPDER
jgi:beta-lactamase class A